MDPKQPGVQQTAAVASPKRYEKSQQLFQTAHTVFPGGVTRSSLERDPHPIYIEEGDGSRVTDVDGNRYLDFANNFTTLIHGHGFAPVVKALGRQISRGTCYGNPTRHEVALAELICARVPAIARIRFVNTGTEAVMAAIKAARAYTGRVKVAKLEGAYHGAYDWAEVSEDSAPDNWGDLRRPASVGYCGGTPESVVEETVILPLNAHRETLAILESCAADLACILIDVMPSRAGMVLADYTYLSMLREFSSKHGIVLISDEVLNFRQSYRGAAARFQLRPDLITLGKVIGGGMPIGAVGGGEGIMSVFDNSDGRAIVPQGGTFSANPLSMVAGRASMEALDQAAFEHLERLGNYARAGLSKAIARSGQPFSFTGQASLIKLHPKAEAPKTGRDAYQNPHEKRLLKSLQCYLLGKGILLAAGGLIAISTVMTEAEIDELISAIEQFAAD